MARPSPGPGLSKSRFCAGLQCTKLLWWRVPGGFALCEVKSTLAVKPAHLPDAAIQLFVLRKAGLDVRRVEVLRGLAA